MDVAPTIGVFLAPMAERIDICHTKPDTPERHIARAQCIHDACYQADKTHSSFRKTLREQMSSVKEERTWLNFPSKERPIGLQHFAEKIAGMPWSTMIAILAEADKGLADYFSREALGHGWEALPHGTNRFDLKGRGINYTSTLNDKDSRRMRRDNPEEWEKVVSGKKTLHSAAIGLGYRPKSILLYETMGREKAIQKLNQFFDEIESKISEKRLTCNS